MFFLLCVFARAADAIAPAGTLDRDALIAAVLAESPDVASARAAAAGARARVDAAGAWTDPMVAVGVAPRSLGTDMAGWTVSVAQPLPLWGMRGLEREMAGAGADAEDARSAMMRLDMARMAAMAWADWWWVHRQVAVMQGALDSVDASRDAALSRYAAGRGAAADALAFTAEAAALLAEHHAMEFERDVVRARINTLLRRAPDAPVPPPPDTLDAAPPAGADTARRPELAEVEAMARMAGSEAAMARRARLPMVELMTEWDAMQAMPEHRWMAGVAIEVPLATRSRAGAVAAADAAGARAAAERDRATSAIALDVAEARARYDGQAAALSVIEGALLPAARARVDAARAAFGTGSGEVQALLDAERGLRDAWLRQAQAHAALAVRAADLHLALGTLPGGAR